MRTRASKVAQSDARLRAAGPSAEQKLDVSGQGLWRDLLERALFRRFVGTEAHELGAVAEAVAGDVVVAHLDHELRLQRFPFPGPLRAPPRRPAGRFAGEA